MKEQLNRGDALGQYNLGRCYEFGTGIAQDHTQVKLWYQKAAAQGNADAQTRFDILQKYSSPPGYQYGAPSAYPATAFFQAPGTYGGNSFTLPYSYAKATAEVKAEKKTSFSQRPAAPSPGDAKRDILNTTASGNIDEHTLKNLLQEFKTSGFSPADLTQLQQALTAFSTEEMSISLQWIKQCQAQWGAIETQLATFSQFVDASVDAKAEQADIDRDPSLAAYQRRLQQELAKFMTAYWLSTSGVFKLSDNKKGTVLNAIKGLPLAGTFLGIFVMGLQEANDKYRFYQINRLAELFVDSDMIVQVCQHFSRQMTRAKADEIKSQKVEERAGMKEKAVGFYHDVKKFVGGQLKEWKTTSEVVGVKLQPCEALAMLDGSFLLDQLLQGKTTITKTSDPKAMASQFLHVLGVESASPALTVPIVVGRSRGVTTSLKFGAPPVSVGHGRAVTTPLKFFGAFPTSEAGVEIRGADGVAAVSKVVSAVTAADSKANAAHAQAATATEAARSAQEEVTALKKQLEEERARRLSAERREQAYKAQEEAMRAMREQRLKEIESNLSRTRAQLQPLDTLNELLFEVGSAGDQKQINARAVDKIEFGFARLNAKDDEARRKALEELAAQKEEIEALREELANLKEQVGRPAFSQRKQRQLTHSFWRGTDQEGASIPPMGAGLSHAPQLQAAPDHRAALLGNPDVIRPGQRSGSGSSKLRS